MFVPWINEPDPADGPDTPPVTNGEVVFGVGRYDQLAGGHLGSWVVYDVYLYGDERPCYTATVEKGRK